MKAVEKSLRAMGSRRVLVGIPSSANDRRPAPGEKAAPAGNAMIGYWMEYGAPEANIPARPWLGPGMKDAQPDIARRLAKAGAGLVSEGVGVDIDSTLNGIGLVAVSAVRKKITTGPFAPLAESTLTSRRRRGRTGTKPLIDTSQMLQAVNYVIRDTDTSKKSNNDEGKEEPPEETPDAPAEAAPAEGAAEGVLGSVEADVAGVAEALI